jgi:predicted dehydrogenase
MEALTTDALRRMAEARGLALTDAELEGLLPLVQAARALIDTIEIPAGSETEPASQYRIL